MTNIFRSSIQVSLLKLAALLALVSWLVSCGNDAGDALPNFAGPYIKAGIACGLCAGICQDTLVITPDHLFYKAVIYGDGDPQTTIQNSSFSQEEWDDLLSTVDATAFNDLDIETCSRCSDGCDRHYEIRAGGISNRVAVFYNDTLPSLGDFQSKVEAIRLSFQD